MTAAVFDYGAWAARYPGLAATTSSATANAMFQDAALTLLSNSDASVVQDVPTRLALFNMLVAHLATLAARDAETGGALVGRISNASEGSVSVGVADYPVGSGKWFEQTGPGALYWQAIRPYRQGRYQPGPEVYRTRVLNRPLFRGW